MDEIEVLIVLPSNHGVVAANPLGEQGHSLVPRANSSQRQHSERYEVSGLDQFGPYPPAVVGGICRVEGLFPAIVEFNESCILDPVRLGWGDGEDHPLADVLVRLEDHLDI